jgi:DNA-binding YbaB/EbfC family protein
MTENQPGDLPGDLPGEMPGGFDLSAMLEQAQQMQSQLVAAQEELASSSVQGSAGGVEVTLTGTGELTGVRITKGYFDPEDEDSLADLGDLVVAAYRDARARTDELAQQALGPLAGGLGGLGGLGGSGGPGGFGV